MHVDVLLIANGSKTEQQYCKYDEIMWLTLISDTFQKKIYFITWD